MFYGYGPGMPSYDPKKAEALAFAMEQALNAVRAEVKAGMSDWLKDAWPEGTLPSSAQPTGEWWPGDWPYIQLDGPYGGPTLRRITHLPDVVRDELVSRCDAAYRRTMGLPEPEVSDG